jgi:hypothetical protein
LEKQKREPLLSPHNSSLGHSLIFLLPAFGRHSHLHLPTILFPSRSPQTGLHRTLNLQQQRLLPHQQRLLPFWFPQQQQPQTSQDSPRSSSSSATDHKQRHRRLRLNRPPEAAVLTGDPTSHDPLLLCNELWPSIIASALTLEPSATRKRKKERKTYLKELKLKKEGGRSKSEKKKRIRNFACVFLVLQVTANEEGEKGGSRAYVTNFLAAAREPTGRQ